MLMHWHTWLDGCEAQMCISVYYLSTNVWHIMLMSRRTLQWMKYCCTKTLICQIRWQYQPRLIRIFIQKCLNLYISEKDLKIATIKNKLHSMICFNVIFIFCLWALTVLTGPKLQHKTIEQRYTINWRTVSVWQIFYKVLKFWLRLCMKDMGSMSSVLITGRHYAWYLSKGFN